MTLVCEMAIKCEFYYTKSNLAIMFTDCIIHFLATLDPFDSFTTRKGLMHRQYANKKKTRKILP